MLSQLLMTLKGALLLYAAAYGFAYLLKREDARWIMKGPVTLLVGLFVIGMWGHWVWVPFAALALSIPLLARNRADAAALYAIAIVSLPDLSVPVAIGSVYLMAFSKWVFCALGLAISFFMFPADPARRRLRGRFDIPFFLLLALSVVQIRDQNFTSSLRVLLDPLFTLVLPYLLLSRFLTRPEHVRRFVVAFAFSGFAMALVAFVEARAHWLIYKTMYATLHISERLSPYLKQRGGMLRAPASFPESTSLGVFLAMAFVAVLAISGSFKTKTRWLAALAVIILGALAANSRNSYICIGIGLLAFDFYRRRYGALTTKAAVAGLSYLILLALAQVSTYVASILGLTADTASTADYRRELLRRGIEEIRKHPYLGTSLSKAMANLEDLRQGEGIIDLVNGYVYYGLVAGIGGAIALLMIFVTLCAAMLVARRDLKADRSIEASGALVFAVSTAAILSSFYGGFGGAGSTPFFELMALGSALWAVRRVVRPPERVAPAVIREPAPSSRPRRTRPTDDLGIEASKLLT